ncbi:hypothetical protein SAMN05216330_11911 [Bradyrhizobium sp. Ghvi]|nr:hypothetical protein SAMN05216330_11911 [Bradyrhizobium sp. Ghvi]
MAVVDVSVQLSQQSMQEVAGVVILCVAVQDLMSER